MTLADRQAAMTRAERFAKAAHMEIEHVHLTLNRAVLPVLPVLPLPEDGEDDEAYLKRGAVGVP